MIKYNPILALVFSHNGSDYANSFSSHTVDMS